MKDFKFFQFWKTKSNIFLTSMLYIQLNKMKKLKQVYGDWALITGASSGIGKEFAIELAKRGINMVLVARRESKLNELANDLKKNNHIKTKIISIDLSKADFLDQIRSITDSIDIGILVNNAGIWIMDDYLNVAIQDELKMIDLNIKAPAILTHHFGKKMVKQKKGAIINIASILAYTGVPYSTAYAATKAYELVKSEGLWYELKQYGIDVLSVNPGLVASEMTNNYNFSHMPNKLLKPKTVVKSALSAIGKKTQTIPGTFNKVLGFILKRLGTRKLNTIIFGILIGQANKNKHRILNHNK